jgi:mobilization protein NikA
MARHRKTYAGERRTVHLGVQLTPSERAELEFAAAEAGASLSQYVRELCLRRTVEAATVGGARRNPEAKRLMHELSAIGNNLNQLARVANTTRHAPQESALRAAIEVLKAAMAHVLAL